MNGSLEVFTSAAHKGGVGKTFTLRLLYQSLSRILEMNGEKRKVLVVDCDPQANTSGRWLAMEVETRGRIMGKLPPIHPDLDDNERSDITDIWIKGVAPLPYPTRHPKIDVVPAREVLMETLAAKPEQFHALGIREWLRQPEVAEEYCAVFIDTPPSKGLMTQAALAAATQCFVPVTYETYPVDGMDAMLHFIDSEIMSRTGSDYPELNFLGIIPNLVSAGNASIHNAYKDALLEHPVYQRFLLPFELKRLAAHTETDAKTVLPGDLFDYSTKSHSHVIRGVEAFCHGMFSRVPTFANWNLDFRRGQSFEPEAAQ